MFVAWHGLAMDSAFWILWTTFWGAQLARVQPVSSERAGRHPPHALPTREKCGRCESAVLPAAVLCCASVRQDSSSIHTEGAPEEHKQWLLTVLLPRACCAVPCCCVLRVARPPLNHSRSPSHSFPLVSQRYVSPVSGSSGIATLAGAVARACTSRAIPDSVL